MGRTSVAIVVVGMLLCSCASPTAQPTATPPAHQVAVQSTATPLPTSTAVPSATRTITPANEGCVRATAEIPEGQNPTHFMTSGPASGCYDSVGGFLDDIGLSWEEFAPGTLITFWTQLPVDSEGVVIPPTPTATPTAAPTPTPLPPTATPIPQDELLLRKETIAQYVERLVVAFYQPWFGSSAWGEWSHWGGQGDTGPSDLHDPQVFLPDGTRDIASVFYPLIGPYDSSKREVMEYHIRLAQAMGIDAYVVDWYGARDHPGTNLAFMDVNLAKMMDISELLGFHVAVLYEPKIHFNGWIDHASRQERIDAVTADLTYILETHAQRDPYLKIADIPVVFVWGISEMSPEEWSGVVTQLERQGQVFLLVGDATDERYYYAFGALYEWINYEGVVHYGFQETPYSWQQLVNDRVRKACEGSTDRFFAAGVWPGFDDTGVWGWGAGPRVLDRLEGDFYKQTWQAALDSSAPWILIMTFNDWNEGTIVEASLQFGYEYAVMTQDFVERFKGVSLDDNLMQQITEQYLATYGRR